MRIQKIDQINSRRVQVCFEDEKPICMPRKEFELLQLEEGEEISEEIYQKILDILLLPEAKKKAMDYLVRQDHAEGELYHKLLRKGFPESVSRQAIEYVKSFHYLDDFRYARNFIEVRRNAKSRYELTMELRKRSVSDDVIEAAFEEVGFEDESAALKNLIRKKCPQGTEGLSFQQKQKVIAYLARKGFRFEEIKKCLGVSEDD